MDAISYSHSAKQAKRIKKFINEPDSSSGVVTVPKVIASGETITIPTGRMAVLPNVQVDGTLNVQGDVFIPSGATMSKVVEKVTSTDNAIVRFNGITGDVQNSGVIIDDSNNVGIGGTPDSKLSIFGTAGTNPYAHIKDANGADLYLQAVGNSDVRIGSASSHNLLLMVNGSTKATLDTNGNVGIGATPSAWYAGIKALEIGSFSAFYQGQGGEQNLESNSYRSGASVWTYKVSGVGASRYMNNFGQHVWQTAPSGTAGNTITWANAMSLDASGDLTLGQSIFRRSVTGLLSEGIDVLNLYQPVGYNTRFSIVNGASPNVANAGFLIARNSVTSRSINAGGTINASGADYAEYEYSNDITLVKGQIVGFKEDGTLTDKYSESIRFAIKSTNPSIVGGDTWGIEEIIGKRPERPVKSEELTDEEFAELEELYELELSDFEARLEVERQKVDRIAYAGKVPVNVYGAVAGQYVIAIEKDGGIDGKLVNKSDMTFAEYQDAVGRVNKILDDGRAEVAVIIH